MLHKSIDARLQLLQRTLPEGIRNRVPLWINGSWCEPASGQYQFTVDPTTGEPLLEVALASGIDVEKAVQAASAAQDRWWKADGQDRARILRQIAEAIRANGPLLGLLDTLDAGRPIRDSTTRDIERAARTFEFFAGMTDRIRGAVVPVQPGKLNLVEHEPYGIVGAIIPWNYPLTNAAGKIAPALATGNAVILKPAEEFPLSALVLAWVAGEGGLPSGLLNVLSGLGSVAGEAIVRHPSVGKIAFTGSTEVGRYLSEVCGRLLKSTTLELGGKTGFLVFADANLDSAADAFVYSAFNNAGQTCTAASRLLVERQIVDQFLGHVERRLGNIRIGDPLDPDFHVGPIISASQRDKVRRFTAEADALHIRRLRAGSRPMPDTGYFVEPVIYCDVDPRVPIAQEEVFGPVVAVSSFGDEAEAVELSNGTPYGLATTIWTESLRRVQRLIPQIQSGLIWVNTVHSLHPGSPYGGHKQSGLGSEMGAEAIQQHMRTKSVWLEEQPWKAVWY